MKNTVENNFRIWDQKYDWPRDGDEWDGQSRLSHQPYDEWKKSIIETFIAPNISENSIALEIAPGHGRWTTGIVEFCKEIILIDLSPSCIEFCKKRFASFNHVRYIVNDGKSLNGVKDNYVDFVWSYDSFVHMDKNTIEAYLNEISRVLKPEVIGIIPNPCSRHALLWLDFLRRKGEIGNRFYNLISMGKKGYGDDGWRSNISKRLFKELAVDKGLGVEAQMQRWGKNHEFGIPRYGDFITILRKNQSR